MPQYLWRCTTQDGQEGAVRIEAPTPEEARQLLQSQGYSGLALFTDDVVAATKASFGESPAKTDLFTPEAEADLMRRTRTTFLSLLWRSFKPGLALYLIVAVFIGIRLLRRHHWATIDTVSVLLAVGATVYVALKSLTSYLFTKLNDAKEWHRWDEVLRLLAIMERVSSFTWSKVPAAQLARYRAEALAGKGDLAQALAVFEPWRNTEGTPEWLYLAHLAGIYDLTSDFDRAITCMRQALECQRAKGTLLIDLAFRLVYRKRDARAAAQALAEAEEQELTQLAQPFVKRIKGMIALEQGELAAAKAHLLKALEQTSRLKGMDLIYSNLMLIQAYLCLAEARLGEMDSASRRLKLARPYLEATKQADLLNRCQAAVAA